MKRPTGDRLLAWSEVAFLVSQIFVTLALGYWLAAEIFGKACS